MQRALRFLALVLPVALVTVPVALAGAEPSAERSGSTPSGDRPLEASTSETIASTVREAQVAAVAATADARRVPPAQIVRVRPGQTVALRARPNGPIALSAGDTTEFGSHQKFGVVRQHGRWLGVTAPALPNGRVGWVSRRSGSIAVERTHWSIRADVSRRQVVLKRDGKVVRRFGVAVGRPGSPTPTGRFAITDKIAGDRFGRYYGCCILAISATQPKTPPGWTGGNRMAIHGTTDQGSIGAAASAGCLRAADADLRFLMNRAPVGTPVVIRP